MVRSLADRSSADYITSTGWKGLPLRRMSWVKNWGVLICIRFTCTTGRSPTATVALSQTTIYKRIGSPSPSIVLLSVLSGNFQTLEEIFAENNGFRQECALFNQDGARFDCIWHYGGRFLSAALLRSLRLTSTLDCEQPWRIQSVQNSSDCIHPTDGWSQLASSPKVCTR